MNAIIATQWEYTLRTYPEFASSIGDKRYNGRLGDVSQHQVDRTLAQARRVLAQLEALDTRGFTDQDRLSHDLMALDLREQLEAARFREWQMPVTQVGGVHIDLPQLVPLLSFASTKDYDDYVARLNQVPRLFRQTTQQMRAGMAAGLMPPRILLTQVATQAEAIATQQPDSTPFAQPLLRIPGELSAAEKDRLRGRVITAIRDSVLPPYVRFAAFVRTDYAPRGRADIGLWALPDGAARYAFAIRRLTTTNLTADSIHAVGLREVSRIEGEKLAVVRRLGYADLKSFRDSLKKLRALHPASPDAILDEYRAYVAQMTAKLPQLFGRLPKATVQVMPVQPYREKEASSAQYFTGTPDGSRPGYIYVNTYDYADQLTIHNESTAYHEGVPGHHLQLSIAQELPGLPPFRQQASYTAFIEGWALYAERLGKEVGFYTDPYKDYGRLDDELLRAVRLVLDTGIHGKRWTRDQAVDFFHEHSTENEASVQSETDRYIAWPGQALAYKVGQLTILRLRDQARQSLGDRFDIRAFHDAVLDAGALPMDMLEQHISGWIDRRRQ